jgi:energy-coupling factor transporter ATP-binding protein EcfA2
MFRGKSFYAIWDEEKQTWTTNHFFVPILVDRQLRAFKEKYLEQSAINEKHIVVRWLRDFASGSWIQYQNFVKNMIDNSFNLDDNLTFANSKVSKKDHVSKRLPYPLESGPVEAWNELVSTIFEPDERKKIEWAIGAIVAGEAKNIQKFLVLYGASGGGKSTILNIIQKLFQGYYTIFESAALGSRQSEFAMEPFKGNPLVAVEHDGDLSRIEDNTRLNSLIAHEELIINEKFKSKYTSRSNAFLFIGTNKPVKITDAKSGLIRRLIDVKTSGVTVSPDRYSVLMSQIDFELGAIAHHCQEVYRSMGKNYYINYIPLEMMYETDVFYNFIESNYYIFLDNDEVTLEQAWSMYKTYCDEALVEHRLQRHKFQAELKNYFRNFSDRGRIEGKQVRKVYSGFRADRFTSKDSQKQPISISLTLDSELSILDEVCGDYPAQYALESTGLPPKRWSAVTTTLKDLDTTKLHYVILPENHIYIDFDIKDDSGEKSAELNLEAASKFPPTYAEYSKSHKGLHLHYIYDGDVTKLANSYSEGIEIKRCTYGDVGPSSLRRQLSKCNNIPIAHLNGGLPLKGEKMIDIKAVTSEKGLRELIARNLKKEIHPGTKPSIDFINKILEDAYASGMKYDLTNLRPKVLAFANNSTNQSEYCVKLVSKMKFQSEELEETLDQENNDDPLVFYDVEVFPNLLVVCWKYQGKDKEVVRMINPSPKEIEDLMKMKLVGFNCRRYDNHILYARYIGYDNEKLFEISSRIIGNESQNGYFRQAYNISYTDIYDFSSIKKSLKAFQIDLGIHHKELGIPWEEKVPEERWIDVAQYCENDVISSEVVFEDRKADFVARQILAELSGMSVNDTTQQHASKIIFGTDPKPQEHFVYTDLSEMFPGYSFDGGKSIYREEETGEGGYVYSEPGIYQNVALLDVASMHPASIENLNLFGKYTERFSDLKTTRLAIKHKQFDKIKSGTFAASIVDKYKDSPELLDGLAYALKIVINIVYGLTSASFPNKFRDSRNVDNIVAKRGALFMIDLKYAVQEKGFKVAHIKTDSIKIPNCTPEIIQFVFDFGKKYGYDFEHEATYSTFCLVNDAVYIAKYKDGKKAGTWNATGAQFAHPFVFKSLFSKEPIEFQDMCESKAVTGKSALYLDMNEGLREDEHNYQFIGKVGLFCPIEPGTGGGLLMREKDGKYYSATGTKGYRWLEAESVKDLGLSDQIDTSYYENLLTDAIEHISKFGDFNKFVSEN